MRFLICVRPCVRSSSVLRAEIAMTLWYVGFFFRFPNLINSGREGGKTCPSIRSLFSPSTTSLLSSSANPFTQVSDGWWPKDLVKLLPYISCSFIQTQLALNLFSLSCIFIPIVNARPTSQTLYLDVYLHQLATDLGGIGPSFHTIRFLNPANPSNLSCYTARLFAALG